MATIVVTNIKGGSGKTTLAINLAASLKGEVLLIDADPQESALKWADSADDPLPFGCMAYKGEKIHREIERLESKYDHIIVDTPPSALAGSAVVRSALLYADLALIPVQPSPLDIRETVSISELIAEISDLRGDDPLQARIVINRLRPSTTFGKQVKEALQEIGIPVCKAVIHEREAHKHAALDGVSVHQVSSRGGKAASEDMKKLTKEINHLL